MSRTWEPPRPIAVVCDRCGASHDLEVVESDIWPAGRLNDNAEFEGFFVATTLGASRLIAHLEFEFFANEAWPTYCTLIDNGNGAVLVCVRLTPGAATFRKHSPATTRFDFIAPMLGPQSVLL